MSSSSEDRNSGPPPVDKSPARQPTRADELQHLGFVGLGLIHEMSTPVQAAQLSLQALLMDIQQTNHLDATLIIERLKREIARHQDLAQKIHRFRRWLKNDGAEFGCVRVADALKSVMDMVTPGLAMNGLPIPQISVESTTSDLSVEADGIWLEHVLTGLVLNASQAAAGRGTEARIEVLHQVSEDWVTLTVQDNGAGFRDSLTVPGSSTGPLGLGMGLVLARRLVYAMRGTLHIDTVDPCGTAVHVRLPKWNAVAIP